VQLDESLNSPVAGPELTCGAAEHLVALLKGRVTDLACLRPTAAEVAVGANIPCPPCAKIPCPPRVGSVCSPRGAWHAVQLP
jgi:hypothetical protein